MKKVLILTLLFMAFAVQAQQFYEYEISPGSIVEGQRIQLTFTAKGDIEFPKGFPAIDTLKYNGNSQKRRISNNYQVKLLIITFTTTTAGLVTIPELTVSIDGKEYTCKERSFKVLPDKSKTILTRILFNGSEQPQKKIYAGQTFTVDYEVSVASDWRYLPQNAFDDYRPKIDAKQLNLRNLSGNSNRFRAFQETEGSRIVDGNSYRTVTYRYFMAPAKSGEYSFTITQQAVAIKQQRGLPRPKSKIKEVSETRKVTIVPVPAPPRDLLSLDITGDWQVSAKTSKAEVKTGHTFEYILSINGKGGDLLRINAPTLDIPGFEIDPRPDINVKHNTGTIKYAMRALHPKAKIPAMTFGTFDHQKEEFVKHPVKVALKITGQALNVPVSPVSNSTTQSATPAVSVKGTFIPPLLTTSENISRPLIRNISPLWLILCPILPLLFFGLLLWKGRSREKSSSSKNKAQQAKKIKELCQQLNKGDNQNIVDSQLIPTLCEYHGLPQGATADELADVLEDKELATMLQQISHDSYLPTSVINANLKQLSSLLLKSLAVLIFCLPTNIKAQEQSTFELYRAAEYEQAADGFEKLLLNDENNTALHTNLGHCYFMMEKHVKALAHYETAARLSPENEQISHSINATLKLLKISRESDLFSITNRLRPDQWLTAAIVIWIIFWAILLFQLLKNIPSKRWTALTGSVLCGLSIVIYSSQLQSRYKTGQAILLNDAATFTNADKDPSSKAPLPKGMIVQVIQTKNNLCEVALNDTTLWVPKETLFKIW